MQKITYLSLFIGSKRLTPLSRKKKNQEEASLHKLQVATFPSSIHIITFLHDLDPMVIWTLSFMFWAPLQVIKN